MEHVLYFGFTLAFGALMFFMGQKSVRLVGQRVETIKSSDSRTVAEWTAVQPGKVMYAPEDGPDEITMFAPPKYADLVKNYKKGGDK